MRRAILPLVLALSAAMPASAQTGINGAGQASRADGPGWGRELRDVGRRAERARERGDLSRREARAIQRERRMIETLGERYARDGLSDSEYYELQTRTFALRDLAAAPNRPAPPPAPPPR